MKYLSTLLGVGLLAAVAVQATPFWYAYEATNTLPEDEGWSRLIYGPPANRYLEDGCLVVDSPSLGTADFDRMVLPGQIHVDPGEMFLMEWRLKIDSIVGHYDPSIGIFADDRWGVGFEFNTNSLKSAFEDDVSASFAPGVFHEFRFASNNMRDYDLYVDGALAIAGSFWESLTSSMVAWGDGIQGGASLTRWDWFRFGVVVPEPNAGALVCAFLLVVRRGR